MKKSRLTDQQIAFGLKQADAGVPVEEVCRKPGISQQTYLPLDVMVRRSGCLRGASVEAPGGGAQEAR